MAITSLLGGSSSGARGQVAGFYKEAINIAQKSSNITYSSNTTLTNWVAAKTLTVNAGVTLSGIADGSLTFIFADTLVLNGTIAAAQVALGSIGGKAASYSSQGGNGGNGSANLFIFARNITGSGSITAAGVNGTNGIIGTYATPMNGSSLIGGSGRYLGTAYTAMAGPAANLFPGNASAGLKQTTLFGTSTFYWAQFPPLFNLQENYALWSGAASGGTVIAYTAGNGGQNYSNGGNGGASYWASGGIGGADYSSSADHYAAGGGGGGAGGLVFLATENALPASITITAKGGNGGNGVLITNGTRTGGGGGGGGGGLITIYAPSNAATVTVAGGSVGTGGTFVAAVAGGAGIYNMVFDNLS